MNRFMLAGRRTALAFALVAALTPAPVSAAQNDWPTIRADYREGNFPDALTRLRALLAVNPDDREALYYAAIIHWRLEDYASAAAAYRRVLALDAEGPFGQDARMWLATYGQSIPSPPPSVAPAPVPRPTASLTPAVRGPLASPSSSARGGLLPLDALRPPKGPRKGPEGSGPFQVPLTAKAPWLQAQPGGKNRRARSANARPGYFKVADGSFEFVPPSGFVLLDEGTQGAELSALFGPPKRALTGEAPPTLLITWREFSDLAALKPDQRIAKERQLLAMEASMYGPGAVLEARFGGPCYRVHQARGAWGADTLLFFKHGKLYALTFGGDAKQLEPYQAQVLKSWQTPIFYP